MSNLLLVLLALVNIIQFILSKKNRNSGDKYLINKEKYIRNHLKKIYANLSKEYESKYLKRKNKLDSKLNSVNNQFYDIEGKIKKEKKELDGIKKEKIRIDSNLQKLRIEEQSLNNSIESIRAELENYEVGFYENKYDFINSTKYKNKIKEIRSNQKSIIKSKKAIHFSTEWTVNDNKREGQKMMTRTRKLMLRAFNGECDSIIANVSYKNILSMESRLDKSYEMINRLGEVQSAYITDKYYRLKKQELFMVYEYQEKLYLEKEELKLIKQQMREEEKAQKEFAKALMKAEKEAEMYLKALEVARIEVKTANHEKLKKLQKEIASLEIKLEEAEKNKRAISQAQITKSGFVYIISNIGAFGEGVYKIGMTRRLEPFERISELNGPSVPFKFDVHAMIFSKNAPNLEMSLHKMLSKYKMNRINSRKEFFEVDLKKIEECARKIESFENEFIFEHEAKEYRQSLAIKNENHDNKDDYLIP